MYTKRSRKTALNCPRLVRNERGSVLALVAAGLVVFIGMAALSIDLGMIYSGRSEAQRSAEAGAHAGASILALASNDVDGARAAARTYTEANQVRQGTLEVLDEDIDVDLPNQLVRVRVQRSEARGNPVATFFARVLGIPTVNISAMAAAQAWPGGGVNCILPLIIPDRWSLTSSTPYQWPTMSETFDPDGDDLYIPWGAAGPGPPTGYGTPDRGTPIQITTGSPNAAPRPGWYYNIRLPGASGTNDYRAAITGCWNPDSIYEIGMEVTKEPGNFPVPTGRAFQALIASDPNAVWNPTANRGHGCVTTSGSNECRGSSRIRPILMFSPEEWPIIPNGAHAVTVSNFVGVFVESSTNQGDVWVRFMNYMAIRPASEWSPDSNLPRVVRIVE